MIALSPLSTRSMTIMFMSTRNSLYKNSISDTYYYDKRDITPYRNMMPVKASLIPVHKTNQTSDHIPDFMASWVVLWYNNSPNTTPIKGHKTIPIGPKKNHTISPIVAHRVPALLPPNFFVHRIGMIYSNTIVSTVSSIITTQKPAQNVSYLLSSIMSNPNRLTGGPGSIGAKDHITHKRRKMIAKIANTISIIFYK